MIIFSTIESILSIVFIILVGYILTGKGWFDEKVSKTFSRIITNIALPSYMIWNLMSTFSHDLLLDLAPGLIVPFTSIITSYVVGNVIAKLLHIQKNRQGTFSSMFSLSNTIFIGLPVNLALFGEKSMPYVLLYYIANTSLFWTIGANGIRADGASGQGKVKFSEVLKNIFSPPLLGFIAAIIFILLGIRLPHFIIDTCKYFGNLTTPLSMLFIGIAIYAVKLKNIKFSKDMGMILLGRFVIAPLIVMAITYAMPLPILMKKVFIIQSTLPVMTLTAVVAKSYQADAEYAAVMTTVTTIAAIITIPVYMLIFQYYF
ncbi:AEC family transporter [Pelosinus sp. sgz500959]|uniref:AEC family transporter n=1 Tax=Pelosinus sp. sgz500959 TaxID=3242472 RepID=UPI00366E2F4B